MSFWDREDEKLVGKKVVGLQKPFAQGDEEITFLCEGVDRFYRGKSSTHGSRASLV
jgi:hypothetical protein